MDIHVTHINHDGYKALTVERKTCEWQQDRDIYIEEL